jgi:NDP-sugar pyrophosphorylase family protein
MRGLLLAAGEGTRLRPLTDDRPKPMVEAAGAPLIAHLLGWLRRNGVDEVAINLNYKPAPLQAYVGDGSSFGVRVRYSLEPRLLGSAGALVPLRDFFIGQESFVVLCGDVLTGLDLQPVIDQHAQHGADITLVVTEADDPTRCGIVEFDESGTITRFQEKPSRDEVFSPWANAGIYVCGASVLDALPDPCPIPYDFAQDLFPRMLAASMTMMAFATDAPIFDIGSAERLQAASEALLAGRMSAPVELPKC